MEVVGQTHTKQNLNRIRIQVIQRKVNNYNNVKREGFVYLLVSEKHPGWVKVGITTDLKKRLSNYCTHSPDNTFKYIKTKKSDYCKRLELLCILSFNKLCHESHKREWFKLSDKQDPASIVEINANLKLTFLDFYDYRELVKK